MTFKKRDGGAWSDITAPKRREAGAWVTPGFVKVMEAGVWVTVWPTGPVSPVVTIANHAMRSESIAEINPFPPPAVLRAPGRSTFQLTSAGLAKGYVIEDDGTGSGIERSSTFTNWLTSGSASDVEVRATVTFGAVDSGSATGVWLSMASDHFWRADTSNNASSDADQCILTVELRDATTLAVLDSATITLSEGPSWSIA